LDDPVPFDGDEGDGFRLSRLESDRRSCDGAMERRWVSSVLAWRGGKAEMGLNDKEGEYLTCWNVEVLAITSPSVEGEPWVDLEEREMGADLRDKQLMSRDMTDGSIWEDTDLYRTVSGVGLMRERIIRRRRVLVKRFDTEADWAEGTCDSELDPISPLVENDTLLLTHYSSGQVLVGVMILRFEREEIVGRNGEEGSVKSEVEVAVLGRDGFMYGDEKGPGGREMEREIE
jgi:hypothetical protein